MHGRGRGVGEYVMSGASRRSPRLQVGLKATSSPTMKCVREREDAHSIWPRSFSCGSSEARGVQQLDA
eukprot:1264809-Lingulodinium_polyedra.AAC.1